MEEELREIAFGDPAVLPRFVCPQIWTVQVDADVNPAAILANTPSHAIYVTAKLHPGLYSLVTKNCGTVGASVDFNGVCGKVVGVHDTIDSASRSQMVEDVLEGVDHFRRCRLGPFPRDWFIPDSVKNARAKLPLYPQSMWMKVLQQYGEVEGAWLIQEGPMKLFLVALWKNAESVGKIVSDGLGRYVRIPKVSTARPLDVTIVEDDDKPISAPVPLDVAIPSKIQDVSTKGMTAQQFQAFQALSQRVGLLQKENTEMKELLLELQKAEMVAKIDDEIELPALKKFRTPKIDDEIELPALKFRTPPSNGPISSACASSDAPWKSRIRPTSQMHSSLPLNAVAKAPMMEMAPPPTPERKTVPVVLGNLTSLPDPLNLPPAGGMHVGGMAAAGAAARAARRAASQDGAPWKRLKSQAVGQAAAPPIAREKLDTETRINDYHNLLLGLGNGDSSGRDDTGFV